ncbi:MAG: hypothetical protein ABIQ60_09580 [Burkholderiaceae bacterium]
MVATRLYAFLLRRWWAAFILLGLSFALGGLLTLNLLLMLSANFEFLATHGFDAVREGGLLQLLEIVLSGYLAAACFVVFKLCEKVLVDRLVIAQPNKELTREDCDPAG